MKNNIYIYHEKYINNLNMLETAFFASIQSYDVSF